MRPRASSDHSYPPQGSHNDWEEEGTRKSALPSHLYIIRISPIDHALQDVQFYREASDVQFDETGNRKRKYRYGDEDELELEQQERKRRQMLNKEFKLFSEKIAEAATASVSNSVCTRIPLIGNPIFIDWRFIGA